MKVSRILPSGITRRFAVGVLTAAANILWGRLLNRPVPRGPLFVTWQLTFNCNAYCVFCSTHKLHKQRPETLTLERALTIADEIADAGTWVVGFTGGEVLMSPLLLPVIRRLKSRGVVTYIVTNGLLLADYAQDLVESNIDYIVVSLDSDLPEEHDDGRKVKGLFEAALAGIARLNELRHRGRPLVKTTTVLSAKNIDRVEQILDFLETKADVVGLQPIVWGYKEHPHGKSRERLGKFVFADEERARVESAIARAGKRHAVLRSSYFRRVPQFWFAPETLMAEVPCWSPFLRLSITPEGHATHCSTRFGNVGDLCSNSLMEVWNSPAMLHQREIVRTGHNACICWSQDVAFNDLMTHVPLLNKLPTLGEHFSDEDIQKTD